MYQFQTNAKCLQAFLTEEKTIAKYILRHFSVVFTFRKVHLAYWLVQNLHDWNENEQSAMKTVMSTTWLQLMTTNKKWLWKVWTFTSHSPGMTYCSLAVTEETKRGGCQSGVHSCGIAMHQNGHIYMYKAYIWRQMTTCWLNREAGDCLCSWQYGETVIQKKVANIWLLLRKWHEGTKKRKRKKHERRKGERGNSFLTRSNKTTRV